MKTISMSGAVLLILLVSIGVVFAVNIISPIEKDIKDMIDQIEKIKHKHAGDPYIQNSCQSQQDELVDLQKNLEKEYEAEVIDAGNQVKKADAEIKRLEGQYGDQIKDLDNKISEHERLLQEGANQLRDARNRGDQNAIKTEEAGIEMGESLKSDLENKKNELIKEFQVKVNLFVNKQNQAMNQAVIARDNIKQKLKKVIKKKKLQPRRRIRYWIVRKIDASGRTYTHIYGCNNYGSPNGCQPPKLNSGDTIQRQGVM